ncbi:MAG TPA: N-acyl homoserine lactonase family protein [Ramlibacter sp.]|nr:N-acyl homoserine lactonase family protein [Ramlibacter sp.]
MSDIQLFGFICGTVTMKKKAAIDDGVGYITLPIPAYLVTHPKGNVLFDTGLHADLLSPESGRLGALARYNEIAFEPGQHILAQLAKLNLGPSDIAYVVNSHLHYDHAGGNSCFPNATMLVQRAEWEAAHDPELMVRNAFNPLDYDVGRIVCIEGRHDVHGDGAIEIFPSYGHTPGHQCLLVRTSDRRIVLSGDACYLTENVERCMVSRLSYNVGQARDALKYLADLQREGAELLIGHDPAQWSTLPRAPQAIA